MSIIELFAANSTVLLLCTLVLGLLVGSFLNVVIYRLPIMMQQEWTDQCCDLLEVKNLKKKHGNFERFDLVIPHSHCPKCEHAITALENIPVISYIIQRGKCTHCKTSISLRYPIIESVTGLLSCLVVYSFGPGLLTLAVLLLTWGLIALTMIDLDHQLLPDEITLPLLWLGLIINSFTYITPLENALWGAVLGYLILWSIYWLFKLATGKEGMGYGDFKLLAALGAWMGWQALPQIILLSSLVGAVVGLSLIIIKGRDKNIPISFGPYLASAGFIVLLWGNQISDFYLQIIM